MNRSNRTLRFLAIFLAIFSPPHTADVKNDGRFGFRTHKNIEINT